MRSVPLPMVSAISRYLTLEPFKHPVAVFPTLRTGVRQGLYQSQFIGTLGTRRFHLLNYSFQIHDLHSFKLSAQRCNFPGWVKLIPGIEAVRIPHERKAYHQGSVLVGNKLGFFDGIHCTDLLPPPSVLSFSSTTNICKLSLRGIIMSCGYFMGNTQFVPPPLKASRHRWETTRIFSDKRNFFLIRRGFFFR